MPASPATSTTEPMPSRLRASAASSASSSSRRPTNSGLEMRPTTRTIIPPGGLRRAKAPSQPAKAKDQATARRQGGGLRLAWAHRQACPQRELPMIAPQLQYIVAQDRIAELHRAAARARATAAATERRNSREGNRITRLTARLARLTARLAPSWP